MNYRLPQVGLAWLFVLMFLEKNKGKSFSKVWRFLCILFFFYFFQYRPCLIRIGIGGLSRDAFLEDRGRVPDIRVMRYES